MVPVFSEWVQEEVRHDQQEGIEVDQMVVDTATGPLRVAAAYKSMYAYGNHFRVISSERSLKTSNSGIAATFRQVCRNSTRDANQIQADVEYVGHIEEILELNYKRHCLVVLVCDFVKANYRGENATIKRDKWGFTLANYSRRYGTICRDSFAFPSHCEQVFYSDAKESPGWRVVLRKEVRGRRVLPNTNNEDDAELFQMGRDEDFEGLRPDRDVGEQELPPAATGVNVYLQPLNPRNTGGGEGRGHRAPNRGGRRGRYGGRGGRGGRRVPISALAEDSEPSSETGSRNVRRRHLEEEEFQTSEGSSSEEEGVSLESTSTEASSSHSEQSDDEHVTH